MAEKKLLGVASLLIALAIIASGCVANQQALDPAKATPAPASAPRIITPSAHALPTANVMPELKSQYNCASICANDEFCSANGTCQQVVLAANKNGTCGNFVCEGNESYDGKTKKAAEPFKQCYFDCQAPCTSSYCNDEVEVQCGCNEYAALATRHGCIEAAQPCTDCGAQEQLLPEVLKIQTQVFNCLVDYFKFRPSRIIYKLFNNPLLEKCANKEGCEGAEGGAGGADYVMFHNLDGFREYGQVAPTKPEHVQADVHETTHYFLYQMLHGIPSWFHEAIAIQTNERLNCSDRQASWGDPYLTEKDTSGIQMSDGTTLTLDFYLRLKQGKTTLSLEEQKDNYIAATLFIIGLKAEYGCGFECVGDIVRKLHEYELKECRTGTNCGIEKGFEPGTWLPMWLGGSEENANQKIKEATNEVIGNDASALFLLLKITK